MSWEIESMTNLKYRTCLLHLIAAVLLSSRSLRAQMIGTYWKCRHLRASPRPQTSRRWYCCPVLVKPARGPGALRSVDRGKWVQVSGRSSSLTSSGYPSRSYARKTRMSPLIMNVYKTRSTRSRGLVTAAFTFLAVLELVGCSSSL